LAELLLFTLLWIWLIASGPARPMAARVEQLVVAEAPAPWVVVPVAVPEPVPRTRHPIVLVHGLFGFDRIGVGPAQSEYFRGVRTHLERLGNEVFVVRLPGRAGIARRAESLAEQVARLPAERVNLVAHSMGGLDARYAISRLGLSSRVASLTTIGTPHRGTPLADGLGPLLSRVGVAGAWDVSTRRMTSFNRDVLDVPGIAYLSVVASIGRELGRTSPLAWPGLWLLGQTPNDGMVPSASQSWGVVLSEVLADHWAQIGWSRHFDARDFYERLLLELSVRGL
jgi:triacylglycerol lipase